MTATNLNVKFKEESSGAIGFSFTGLNDEAVTPNTFTWTLTDTEKNVINSREDQIVTPASTTWVLLQDDDLAIPSGYSPIRLITIKGTYNSILGGIVRNNVTYTDEYEFNICRFKNIHKTHQ